MMIALYVLLAFLVLGTVVAAIGTQAIRRKLPHLTRLQAFLWWFDVSLTRVLWGAAAPVEFDLPTDRGVVVVANHRSSVDPFFLEPRSAVTIRWMVAKEYVESVLFGPFLRACLVIPTNRGGVDTASTRAVVRVLEENGRVGMFPEGRINRTKDLFLPVRPGAALVAIKAKALILPVYIEGSPYGGAAWTPLFMLARVKIHVGKPIDAALFYEELGSGIKEGEAASKLIVEVMRQIAALAGQPDFEPKLAGRNWRRGAGEKEEAAAEVSGEEPLE
jgi:1-acyl-sn-glycerol-3-phosphate acyltransferase